MQVSIHAWLAVLLLVPYPAYNITASLALAHHVAGTSSHAAAGKMSICGWVAVLIAAMQRMFYKLIAIL